VAYLNVGKAAFTICIKTSCTAVLATVNVSLDSPEVDRFFDQLVIAWIAANSQFTSSTRSALIIVHTSAKATTLKKIKKTSCTLWGRIKNLWRCMSDPSQNLTDASSTDQAS